MQPDQCSAVLQFLINTIEREHGITAKVLAAVPADKWEYKPDPKSMSAMELVWHIPSSEQFFMSGVASGEFASGGGGRPEELKTPADIVKWYDEQSASNIARLKSMSGEDAGRVINFFNMFHLPGMAYLQLMLTHSAHHRGQLSAYLRPMGAKVPSIYGPSADEDIMAAASEAKA